MPPSAPMPWSALLALAVVLGASWTVYTLLVRRATIHRRWLELSDWSLANGLSIRPSATAEVPPFLAEKLPACRGLLEMRDATTILAQFESATLDKAGIRQIKHWNVLVRKLGAPWPTTALRPGARAEAVSDFYRLAGFPTFAPNRRFMVHGDDIVAARLLANSSLRALAPPDIAVLLDGPHMVLDFSTRPFDVIEIQRMRSLAEQLALHLPLPRSGRKPCDADARLTNSPQLPE